MPRKRGRFAYEIAIALVLAALLGGGAWLAFGRGSDGREPGEVPSTGPNDRTFSSNDPVKRGCDLPGAWLARIWRGHDPKHSEDVTFVPQEPNYSGGFNVTSHSGPWHYVQNIPLVFYGPGHINPLGPLDERASITDVYPTIGKLLDAPLEARQGTSLDGALVEGAAPPKLVVVIVWDGVGRNVLARWPDAWPNLAEMEQGGASYRGALVGSSPSITPATHSSLGTGAFPRSHGVTAISYRDAKGNVRSSFANRSPADLRLSTFGDQVDQHYGNASKVGMLAWKNWHLGMLGHGSAIPGGDADQLAIISGGTTEGTTPGQPKVTGNDAYYSTPPTLDGLPGLMDHVRALDRADGKADENWMGHGILDLHDNPAWVEYESDLLMEMIKHEGYGADDVPDIVVTNFKMTDIVGHQYTMDAPEEEAVLHAQDAALGRLRDYLEDAVGDYTIVITADHGHTPGAQSTGAWPISEAELQRDVDAHFHVPEGESLIDTTSAVGPFLDRAVTRSMGVTGSAVAEFLNGYTIADNWADKELPAGYEDRGDENVLSAAFSRADYPKVMQCAFGAPKPPAQLGA